MTQNQIAYHNAKEVERHNRMTEQELNRHQLAQEALSKWSNELTEKQIAINQAHYERQDTESERSHKAQEYQALNNWLETRRSNQASESIRTEANAIQSASVAETSRHQQAMENIQDSLNNSVILKNLAEASYTTSNTDLVQARAAESRYQTDVVLPAGVAMDIARTQLLNAQRDTETMKYWVEATQAGRNVAASVGDIFGVAKDLGLGGTTGKASTTAGDFWTQIEAQYK